MFTGSTMIVLTFLNTLMLVANATVTTITSYRIMKESKGNDKKY